MFSINGELIRSTDENQIESEIVSWSTFRNEKGFDFVVFANAKNECYLFEAFYLNNLDKPFFISPSKVAALSFLYVLLDKLDLLPQYISQLLKLK